MNEYLCINDLYCFLFVFFLVLIAEYNSRKCHLGVSFSGLGYKNTIIPQSIVPCPSDWLCANMYLKIKADSVSLPFNISLPFNLNQYLNQYLFRNEPFTLESQHCVPPMNCSDMCRIADLGQLSEVLECEHHCCSHDLCNAEWTKGGE